MTAGRVDPRHIFTSPDEVQSQLLQAVYRFSEPLLEALRTLFHSRASTDGDLNTTYWTRETFIDYLVERNTDAENATRNVGPLLYQMMLHYGSFPFPAGKEQRMTCGVFLRGIAMLSRMRYRILWKDYGSSNGEPVTRKRYSVDDVRLFFQGAASRDAQHTQCPDKLSTDDDEDLLDVLLAVMRGTIGSRNPKTSYKREHVRLAAAALPSSCSRDLLGTVPLEDLRSLAELTVALSARFLAAMPPLSSFSVHCLMESFSRDANDSRYVSWEGFRDVVLGSFPNLLSIISGYIDWTFGITSWFWIEPELMPETPCIREVISQSKVISPEQLVQLLLVIPGGCALHFKSIIFQDRPTAKHASQIAALLQDPGRLLLIKGSTLSQAPCNQDSTVICVYIADPRRFSSHLLEPEAWRNSCIVFSLSPAHSVYYSTRHHDTDCDLDIRRELNGLSLTVESLEIQFTDGLHLLSMKTSSSTIESTIEALEVWAM